MLNRMTLGFLITLMVLPVFSQGQTPKVLLLVPEDNPDYLISDMMLKIEAGAMINILEEAGYEVEVATSSGEMIVVDQNIFIPNYNFAEVNVDDYVGLILPSERTPRRGQIPKRAAEIIRLFYEQGKPIAAQVYGIVWLGEAGVLSGKKFSFVSACVNNIRLKNKLKDGILIGNRPIVKDGNVITSGVCPDISRRFNRPDGTEWLTVAFINEIMISQQ